VAGFENWVKWGTKGPKKKSAFWGKGLKKSQERRFKMRTKDLTFKGNNAGKTEPRGK